MYGYFMAALGKPEECCITGAQIKLFYTGIYAVQFCSQTAMKNVCGGGRIP